MSTKMFVQNFGRFLSNMVMPNIGAFIAWGFITALFIPTGWLPNETLAAMVGPMIMYLLPVLIGIPVVNWLAVIVVRLLVQLQQWVLSLVPISQCLWAQ